jgi:CDP-diglyceride synthetase
MFNNITYPILCFLIPFALTSFYYLVIVRGFITCVFILLLPIFADASAYFAGMFLGKRDNSGKPLHPMAPRLSPKKSLEGLFGALIITTLLMLGYM